MIFGSVKGSLAALSESLTACGGRLLMERKIELRACMAALSREGIDLGTVAVVTQAHPSTVRRWVCRVEEGGLLSDRPRSGRPRTFSEAARLTTIAVYCRQSPPLPGIHRWSLRDAHRYFNEHLLLLGAPIGRATIQRILLEHALRPHRRKYYITQIIAADSKPRRKKAAEKAYARFREKVLDRKGPLARAS